jgi:hypothetical protein
MNRSFTSLCTVAALGLAGFVHTASAETYEVTVTNITAGQTFTPFLAVTHKPQVRLLRLGKPARPGLAELAEGGDVAPLQSQLASVPDRVFATATTDGLLGPGEEVSFMIETGDGFKRLSLAAMLIPTNDTFVALDGIVLPNGGESFYAQAYDAGSEEND